MSEYLRNQAVRSRKRRRHMIKQSLRKFEQISRVVIVWSMSVAIIYALCVAAFREKIFGLEQIVVRGDISKLSESSIRELSGLQIGTHLFRINLDKVQKNIRANPWVEEVAVRRKLPNMLWIYVRERQVAALLNSKAIYLVDNSGKVFKKADSEELTDLPIFTGITDLVTDSDGIGHSLQLQEMLALSRIYERHPLAEHFGCSEINRDKFGRVSILTEHPVLSLQLGNEPNIEQFDRLYTIVSSLREKEQNISSIDLFMERKIVVRHAS